jgi:hypothetical protein
MRALTPLFIFEEVEPDCYRHTARSWSLRDPHVKALMDFGLVPEEMMNIFVLLTPRVAAMIALRLQHVCRKI